MESADLVELYRARKEGRRDDEDAVLAEAKKKRDGPGDPGGASASPSTPPGSGSASRPAPGSPTVPTIGSASRARTVSATDTPSTGPAGQGHAWRPGAQERGRRKEPAPPLDEASAGSVDPAARSGPDARSEDKAARPPPDAQATRAVVPRGALHALDPAMGLSERLLSDTTLTVRGSRVLRAVSLGVLVLSLGGLAWEARAVRMGGAFHTVGNVAVWQALLALAALAALSLVAFRVWPAGRVLRVGLADSQAREWQDVQDQARMLQVAQGLGTGLLVAGALAAVAAYTAFPDAQVVSGLALAAALLLGGVVTGVVVAARRAVLHRLYVQTMMLARMEQVGVGVAADERTAAVLLALDELLGTVPESALHKFLEQEESAWYLELIDRVRGRDDDG